jgi:hypothetical protein
MLPTHIIEEPGDAYYEKENVSTMDMDSRIDEEKMIRALCHKSLDMIMDEIVRIRQFERINDYICFKPTDPGLSVVSDLNSDSESSQNSSIPETLIDSTHGPSKPNSCSPVHPDAAVREISLPGSQESSTDLDMMLTNDVNRSTIKSINNDANDEEEDRILHQIFESKLRDFWDGCRQDVEKIAEKRAKQLVRSWKRDGLSLDSAIEATLKEYGDMYEKAIAVKEMFEYEKQKWKDEVMALAARHTPRVYPRENSFTRREDSCHADQEDDRPDSFSMVYDHPYGLIDAEMENLKKRGRDDSSNEDDESGPSKTSLSLLAPAKRHKFKIPTMATQ